MEKVALITGTSSGIGRATAALLARSGYRVFGAVRNIPSGEPIPNVDFLQLDVRHDESAKEAVRSLLSRAGRIDALVNNAGYTLIGSTVGGRPNSSTA
jgi:NAD(P)-dependent dehydrogenase (short-subunit alcohol dehydrogenase family)